ncbi:hypothetical protein CXP54_23615 [Escherichia albertii]|nr:hypothetical protein CXP54_23615 [Escherichia albertii]
MNRPGRISVSCARCSFCTSEAHSPDFISPDASLNTAGVFIYKQKGKLMMSDIILSRPEVVSRHTDVICSTSIFWCL